MLLVTGGLGPNYSGTNGAAPLGRGPDMTTDTQCCCVWRPGRA